MTPKEMQAKLIRISRLSGNEVTQALLASVVDMKQHATVNIQRNSGTGRQYKRGSRTHTASAPGEFPNTDTGRLVNSLFADALGLVGRFGARTEYAKHLEFGTSKMAARPFMRPTFNAKRKRVSERLKAAINKVLRNG